MRPRILALALPALLMACAAPRRPAAAGGAGTAASQDGAAGRDGAAEKASAAGKEGAAEKASAAGRDGAAGTASAAARAAGKGGAAGRDTAGLILDAAAVVSREHVTPVDAAALVREAARGLESDVAAPGESPRVAGAGAREALEHALARHRAARPDADEAERLSIALASMMIALDDESRLVPEAERRRELLPGDPLPWGVGLVLEDGAPFPRVQRALPGLAGAKAGLGPGLELRSVDGRSTRGLPADDAARLLRGAAQSEAVLELGAPGAASRGLVIRREPAVEHVDCRVLAGEVLYLRARTLAARTAGEVRAHADARGVPSGRVILDLRGNQGGLLDAAGDLADAFLARGPILSISAREPRFTSRREARAGTSRLERARVAVLVDGNTGSGAEAVAAALQDQRRATIVGTPTAGTARVEVLRVVGPATLRYPVAVILRPDGSAIDGRGVQPDVAVAVDEPAPAAVSAAAAGSADSPAAAKPPAAATSGSLAAPRSTPTAPAAPSMPAGPAAPPAPSAPAAPASPSVADVACPGFASPGPVAQDPAVARALAVLADER